MIQELAEENKSLNSLIEEMQSHEDAQIQITKEKFKDALAVEQTKNNELESEITKLKSKIDVLNDESERAAIKLGENLQKLANVDLVEVPPPPATFYNYSLYSFYIIMFLFLRLDGVKEGHSGFNYFGQ